MPLHHGAKVWSLPPTSLIYLEKTSRIVFLACYHLSGPRLKPCFDHELEFFSVFQFVLLCKCLAPAFWNFHLKCGPHLKLLPWRKCFRLSTFFSSILWMFFSVFNYFAVCFVFFFLVLKHPDGFPQQRWSSIHGQYCRKELFTVLTSISCHVTKYF